MPIQGLRFNIVANGEAHQSFQATGSFTAYNPNDGYTLIALDRTATLLDYDHKLPSQSGGHFPGPINSYLSMVFVDQSGGGLSGQVIVYGSSDIIQIPTFWSIGRAVQSLVTTFDITQGVQPANPSTGVTRLWSDGQGNLHLLQSNGSDATVLSSANYNTLIALGADLYGTPNAAHVGVRMGSSIGAYDNGGTRHPVLGPTTDNWTQINSISQGVTFANLANSVRLVSISDGGVLFCGPVIPGLGAAGDINANRGANNGVYYFGNGGQYLYFDGTNFTLQGGTFFTATATTCQFVNVSCTGSVSGVTVVATGGNVQLNTASAIYWPNQGLQIYPSGGNCQIIQPIVTPAILAQTVYLQGFGGQPLIQNVGVSIRYAVGPGGIHSFENPGGVLGPWQASGGNITGDLTTAGLLGPTTSVGVLQSYTLGCASPGSRAFWFPTSTIPSLAKDKANLAVLSDADCLARVLDPRVSAQTWDAIQPDKVEEGEQLSYHPRAVGFIADEMELVVPEVITMLDNEPIGITYAQITALLWGGLREVERRVKELEQPTTVQPTA